MLESGEECIIVTLLSLSARVQFDGKIHTVHIQKKKKVFRPKTQKETPFTIHMEDYTIDIAPFIHDVIVLSLS